MAVTLVVELWPDQTKAPGMALGAVSQFDIDEVIVKRGGELIALKRKKDAKDPAKSTWEITSPLKWRAVKSRVETMLRLFSETRPSLRGFEGKDNKKYGFDGKNAIEVTIMAGGAVRNHFIVGNRVVARTEIDPRTRRAKKSYETYVMLPKDKFVYQLAGDLREPFDRKPGELRDKKLFEFDAADVAKIELHKMSADEADVTLVGTTKEEKKLVSDPKDALKKKKRTWSFVAPKEIDCDQSQATSFVRRLAALRVKEFHTLDGSLDKFGFSADSPRLKATLEDDTSVTLTFAQKTVEEKPKVDPKKKRKKPSGPKKVTHYYLHLESNKKEVFEVAKYTYEGLFKPYTAFMDRKVLAGVDPKKVKSIELKHDKSLVALERAGKGWKMVSPAGVTVEPNEIERFVKTVTALRAASYEPDAKPEQSGLKEPELYAKLTLEGGESVTFVLGKKNKGKSRIYGQVLRQKGRIVPALFYTSVERQLKKTALDFQSKVVFKLDPSKLSNLSLRYREKGKTTKLMLRREKAADGKSHWMVVSPEPKVYGDAKKIGALVKRIGQLRASKFYPGKTATEVNLVKDKAYVEISLSDGTGSRQSLIISSKSDGSYLYAKGGAPSGVFSISKYVIKSLLKKKDDLKGVAPAPPKNETPKGPTLEKKPAPKKPTLE
ncbi:MAG: DUF4340 domain-containing protein, partial [Myxococcales bacterium]|nr:DUF4340 domain-containing protein [Myxococcales bacterium]